MNQFGPPRAGEADGWFRAGSIEVTTSVFSASLATLSMFLWAIAPRLFAEPFYLNSTDVLGGQVWRLVTWPMVNPASIWVVLSIAMLYLIGGQIEAVTGRIRYTWILAALTVVPAVVGTALGVGEAFGLQFLTSGLFVILVLWQPTARTFFNLPLWGLVVVFEVITALQIIAARDWALLGFFITGLGVAALAARAFNLTEFEQIPKVPLPQFVTGDPYQKANRARERQARQRKSSSGTTRSTSRPRRRDRQPAEVVPIRPEARLDRESQNDMDQLLDKISASGMDSLTPDERRRLDDLSRRLRGN